MVTKINYKDYKFNSNLSSASPTLIIPLFSGMDSTSNNKDASAGVEKAVIIIFDRGNNMT